MTKPLCQKITVVVATHKPYAMPKENIYLPLQVGKSIHPTIGLSGDDTGKNISNKNPYFCELTGLYWAWKNIKSDYVGLVHYRRHFRARYKRKKDLSSVLTGGELENYLKDTNIIVPKKRHYYIESIENHYKHTMHGETLDATKEIIFRKYPEYKESLKQVFKRRSMHAFNMFIMRKDLFDSYCGWLFDILFELEKAMKGKKYDDFHARFYGRVSELLLDVWIDYNHANYIEVPVLYLESVNWPKKIYRFLSAKYLGRKYDSSF